MVADSAGNPRAEAHLDFGRLRGPFGKLGAGSKGPAHPR
jgi:hypothetical protein